MHPILDHPIAGHWAPQHPERLQLYSWPTPNGVKVAIMLEETGLPYEAHAVSIRGDQRTAGFLALNPNGRIPAIIDPNGPDGEAVALWESGAILLYLAEKTRQLLPAGARARAETQQWLMFQMSAIGPMFGQYGYFKRFAGSEIEDPRPRQHFIDESRRLLGILEQQLSRHPFIQGQRYSIADIAIFPWLRAVRDNYGGGQDLAMDEHVNTMAWLERCLQRPAVQRGLEIPRIDG